MKVSKIQEILEEERYNEIEEELSVDNVYICDLMSDVLAFAQNNDVLLTGTVNPQVIRTCQMVDIRAIVFVRGKEPTEDIVEQATHAGILLLGTRHSMYSARAMLYEAGLVGVEIVIDF